jgi:2-keto-4-pentenoate hydratase/2-oxohepta-3-ene-1,7-dioic acid hydratase in catechol pathway
VKVIRYRRNDGVVRAGILKGDDVLDAGTSVLDASAGELVGSITDVALEAPVLPGKIVAVGLNYRDHAEETGQTIPGAPILFAKFPNTIVGPGSPIRIPPITQQVDYEAELGVVIAKRARGVPEGKALNHVLGYTCVNDVSARDLQFADGQWVRGKSPDTFCPVGPWIVTADEIPDPQMLGIRCVVNDQKLQDSTTANMIFGVAALIAFISQAITLEPGDLIATGTPAGVGFVRKPPVFLIDGDEVSVEIDQIGRLVSPVVAENS